MALFRRFFYRKPPDRLLEISERVYVFDCCFSSDVMEEDEYKVYMGGIVTQLQDYSPEASFMVFNFREGEKRSQISDILSQYDMTVMDYPRQYEGCPMLPLEMIHHFLKSSESWLSLEGQQNVLLMHCERGGWPVLAFMLAGLLLYRKQYSGEQKTLEMVYKQAPRELLHMLSPLNPQPTQLRYLQYISRRNIGSDWPPSDTPLLLDCLILRLAPILEGGKGCRPLVRVYGQDPSTPANRSSKLLYSTSKTKKRVRHYAQSECALVKMDIFCRVQGDVVLECVHLDEQLVREEMMFRIAFHTAFVRSNILIFNRDEVDLLWDARNQFPRDFKAEVLFMDADAVVPNLNTDASGEDGNETEGTLPEEFFEVEEIFVDVHEGKMEIDNTHEGRKKIETRTAPVGAKTTHGSPPPPPSPPPPSPFLSQRAPPPSPQLASNNLPPTYGMPPLPLPPLTRGGLPPPPPPSLAYEALAPPPLQTHGGPPPSPPLSRGELLSPPPPPLRGGPPPPPPSQSRGGPPPPPLPPLRRGLPQPLRAPSPPAPPLHGAPPLPGEAPPPPPPPLGRAPPPSPTSRGRAPDPPAPPRPPGGGSPPPPGVLGTRPPGPPAAPLPGGRGRGFPRPLAPASKKSSLKPLHWSKVTRALQGSLWDELQRYGESDMMAEFDVSELETLFSASVPKPADKSGGRRKTISSKPEKVNLIDMRRAYNTEIMLTKVKIPLPDMMAAVLALDEAVLDVDHAENLIKFCPTKEEMELLKNYTGDKNNLGKCEQYFMELMKVPRVESKLRVFSFKIQFRTQITEFRKNLSTVNCACEEVRNSFKLKEIMRRILFLGNVLNQGTARGSAIGFKMDSLLKLTDTRATNNKMTLMHFLCKKLADWSPELLDFHQDFSSLEAASKIQLKSLAEEMQAIIKGLEKVMQELAASENDGPVSETFRKTLTGFIGQAEGGVASLTNLYSLVGRNADALILYFNEDPTRCPFEQVTVTLLNFVKLFRKAHEENCKQAEMEKKKAEKEAEVKKAKSVSHAKRSQNI